MKSFKQLNNIVGWIVFAIAATVYALTAEPTGSLWDCGEFIAGAHKLQVVHPPGAPLFLMVGRMFTFVASVVSDVEANPENLAYAVNFMSGLCTAFAVLFVFWSTTIIGRLTLIGKNNEPTMAETLAILGAGVAAGLAGTFATSVWFSAVEGEVYAMSTFFTMLVMWSALKWYQLPDDDKHADRWLIFATYMAGLSIGVHLLSLLIFPMIGILYYYKKYQNHNFWGMILAAGVGAVVLVLVQGFVILRLPSIGASFDLFFVNTLGLPFFSGFVFFIILLIGAVVFGLYKAQQLVHSNLQKALIGFAMILFGLSTYGMILLRASANTPINMNNPSDVYSFVSYLNREQYGDRPLTWGPHFDAQPIDQKITDKYGVVGDKYEKTDRKVEYKYRRSDYMLFPRIGHYDRKAQHRQWMNNKQGKPTSLDNIRFFFNYQLSWMYGRYFMWNFVGRQNGEQGFTPVNPKDGNWLSGINFIDNRLYNQSQLPETIKNEKARNTYYFLPLIFGLLGFFFLFNRNPKMGWVTLSMFFMTGIAIILYSNQPPNEPRERDYVLVGSMLAYCMWIGIGVLYLFDLFKDRLNLAGVPGAALATGLVMTAPFLMGTQNWDDHSRANHTGARDYAINFLESCAPNAIVFTHGDNDTYPLWYAQEMEGIRTDVRVVNLSLLAVDWYIDQLRRKVNNSPRIKMTIPEEGYRGHKRNHVSFSGVDPNFRGPQDLKKVIEFMRQEQPQQRPYQPATYLPTKTVFIPVDKQKVVANGTVSLKDTSKIVSRLQWNIPDKKNTLIKDELAILDIIASNNWERPIYFAVTCKPEKTLGLRGYLQLEGMALRLIPVKSQSENNLGFIGSGRIAVDTMYNNIMTKFKWGGFDKHSLHVDRSFDPSIMSMHMGFIRLSEALIRQGDTTRTVKLLNKYFEAYPHMNFPYSYNTWMVMRQYFRVGAVKDAKKHVKILADETADHLNFYASLSEGKRLAFQQEISFANRAMTEMTQIVETSDDEDLKNYLRQVFAPFNVTQPPG